MPATRRRDAASAAAAADQNDEQGHSSSLLHFNEALSWRAGKAIPISELLPRLQRLGKELRNLEPEGEVDPKNVFKVAQELASPNLLAHKDKGIRAWTVCCVVDLLRICVPHAPFRAQQLKDIFTTIVNYIIPQLADPSSAYNAQHLYVLTSLAEVHSIALITDLDRPEQLIRSLMASSFDIVSGSAKASSGEDVTKVVEGYLTQILVQVIDESSSISPEVTDVIIAQFMRVDPGTEEASAGKKKDPEKTDSSQSDLLLKTYPRAYEMAKAICVSVPERMRTFISQYFSNIIVDASETTQANGFSSKGRHGRGGFDDDEDEMKGLKELGKAHRLIRELWRACPDVLLHVIPQVDAELSAESSSLRLTAAETLSDVAAGIGIAGCPPPVYADPAAYPPPSLSDAIPYAAQASILQIPMSPKPFAQVHASAYESFLSRQHDKSPSVRGAWATGAGRILLTSAGGIGFAEGEEERLIAGLAQLLSDADEKVRLAAIKAIGSFNLADIIRKLGSHGSISSPGSVLATLSDRIRDRKSPVRNEAMHVLGRMWAAASGEIERGNEEVITILGDAPSKLLDAYYVNDPEIHGLLDHVMFEYLLPLNYPPIKAKRLKSDSNQKQSTKQRSELQTHEDDAVDADLIRVRRILTLVHSLDERAKKVFFGMQNRQTQFSRVMAQYLRACEEYNGGVMDKNEVEIQNDLSKWIEAISKTLTEPTHVAADLRKFAKVHDRRNYQLIRFCLNAESEYRTVVKAIKELSKRIQARQAASPSLETMVPLLYRCSLLIYNRSHVPSIMRISRSADGGGLAEAAHELLREMSSRTPEVLKTHIQELCRDLENTAPSDSKPEESSASDMLKACAEFARKFPDEIPGDRKFLVAMTNYALFARCPRAAKHAVLIIMVAGAEKKEMYGKELMAKATKDCTYQNPHFLTRLAAISQVSLLDPKAADRQSETIIRITMQETLFTNRGQSPSSPSSPILEKNGEGYRWSSAPDPEALAKEWSLKCLINFLRSHLDDKSSFTESAAPIYALLSKSIEQEGEVSARKDTPATQRPRIRLMAVKSLLKLCSQRRACEDLVTPTLFNTVALVMQDRLPEVRAGFSRQLKKLVTGERLNHRWYSILFLLAFEPEKRLKQDTMSWLKSRTSALSRRQQQQQQAQAASKAADGGGGSGKPNTVELLLARLLSLLSHHPDFPDRASISNSSTPENFASELLDFAHYIVFYLQSVANDLNLSLIFHVAQRVKQTQDAISNTPEANERLYVLSDLAQAVIRHFAEFKSRQHQKNRARAVNLLETWPGKLKLPLSLFKALPDHKTAQQIAERNYLPEEVAERLEGLVKAMLRPASNATSSRPAEKKRKSETRAKEEEDDDDKGHERKAKRSKKSSWSSSLPVQKLTKAAFASGKVTTKPAKKRTSGDSDTDEQGVDGGVRNNRATPARKSARKSSSAHVKTYAEGDSEEDDEEMERWEKAGEDKNATSAAPRQEAADGEVGGSEAGREDGEEEDRDDDDEEHDVDHGSGSSSGSDNQNDEGEKANEKENKEPSPLSSLPPSPTPTHRPLLAHPQSPSSAKPKSNPKSKSGPRPNSTAAGRSSAPATPTTLPKKPQPRPRPRSTRSGRPRDPSAELDKDNSDPEPDLDPDPKPGVGTRRSDEARKNQSRATKKNAKKDAATTTTTTTTTTRVAKEPVLREKRARGKEKEKTTVENE